MFFKDREYYVYILTNKKGGTLYVGVTSDITGRVWEHKQGVFKGFSSRYGVDRLVYYETFGDIGDAINREKQLKTWNRQWKINLIEEKNPDWEDLYYKLL